MRSISKLKQKPTALNYSLKNSISSVSEKKKKKKKRVMDQTRKTRQPSLLRLERQGKILDVIKKQKLVSNLSFDKESQRSIWKYLTQNIYCSNE